MGISRWIKASELKELYERHGFRVARVLNFSVVMTNDINDYFIEIPNGAIDNAYDIKQTLLGLSRITGIGAVDLFLSHENVIKRIVDYSKLNNNGDNAIIKATAKAVCSICIST